MVSERVALSVFDPLIFELILDPRVIPPHFDGNNYAYWKVRMKAFLKSIDERVWNSVEYGWEKPTTPVSEWQTSQKEAVAFNSKVMNAIFNVVFMKEFKRISNVE